jgi:hypothetical protein
MGQHEYKSRPIGKPLEIDFTSVTRKLNYISKRVAVDVLNLGYLKLSIETADAWTEKMSKLETEQLEGIEEAACLWMKGKTTSMKEDCRSLILLAEYEEKQMKAGLQAVRSLLFSQHTSLEIECLISAGVSIHGTERCESKY